MLARALLNSFVQIQGHDLPNLFSPLDLALLSVLLGAASMQNKIETQTLSLTAFFPTRESHRAIVLQPQTLGLFWQGPVGFSYFPINN